MNFFHAPTSGPLKLVSLAAAFGHSISGRPSPESLAAAPATSVHPDTQPSRTALSNASKLANTAMAAVSPGGPKDASALVPMGAAAAMPAPVAGSSLLAPPLPTLRTSLSQLRFEDSFLPFAHPSNSDDDVQLQCLMLEGSHGGPAAAGYGRYGLGILDHHRHLVLQPRAAVAMGSFCCGNAIAANTMQAAIHASYIRGFQPMADRCTPAFPKGWAVAALKHPLRPLWVW